jgi:hypothetical protein
VNPEPPEPEDVSAVQDDLEPASPAPAFPAPAFPAAPDASVPPLRGLSPAGTRPGDDPGQTLPGLSRSGTPPAPTPVTPGQGTAPSRPGPSAAGTPPPSAAGIPPPGPAGSPATYGYEPGRPPSGFGQPAAPASYGQPAAPYGQPAAPYGQPAAPYGQPAAPPSYGQPGAPPGYGQPGYAPGGFAAAYGSPPPVTGAQPPYGYQGAPGTQFPGGNQPTIAMPWPGAPAAAPPRRSRRGLLAGLVVFVVVAVVAGVLAAVLTRQESPVAMAAQAGQAIAGADGLTFAGTMEGQPASYSVTRAGTVGGTFTASGIPVSRITIQGVTYLKAAQDFWINAGFPGTAAQQAGGNWAKARPQDVADLSAFTPSRIARALKNVGPHPSVTDSTLGGQKIIRLTARGMVFSITTATPNRLVAVSGVAQSYQFTVARLNAASIGPVFAALHSDAAGLQGAADPEANVTLSQKLKFVNCDGPSVCTVAGPVQVSDPGAPAVVLKMTVGFAGAQGGRAFTSCTAEITVTTSAAVSPTCSVRGRVWANWFNGHNGNFFVYANAQFDPLVNSASDVAALQTELNSEQSGG